MPPLTPETESEKSDYEKAQLRRDVRLQRV